MSAGPKEINVLGMMYVLSSTYLIPNRSIQDPKAVAYSEHQCLGWAPLCYLQ